MANTATPFGMIPVNATGGYPYAGSTRMLPIASGLATSIYFGDIVKIVNTGFITKDTGTTTLTPVGVFMGCTYLDSTIGLTFRQYWASGTVPAQSQSAIAYICDDPEAVFRIQADAALTQTTLFNNAAVVQGSGSNLTGNSGVTLSASSAATTNTLPLRIIGWGNNVSTVEAGGQGQGCLAPLDAFPEVLVKWNFGMHAYCQALGQ